MRDARPAATAELHGAGETAAAFARALLGGDAQAAAAYFKPEAQLVTPDGTELSGRHSIAQLLAQLTSSSQRLQIRTGRTILADPIALCTQYWTRSSTGEAERFENASTARLVLARGQRQWQIVIAAPWG